MTIKSMSEEIDDHSSKIREIQCSQESQKLTIANSDKKIQTVSLSVENLNEKHVKIAEQCSILKNENRDRHEQITTMIGNLDALTNEVSSVKDCLEKIKRYTSYRKPTDKVYFYPPNRPKLFVGRYNEITRLEQAFTKHKDNHHMEVICGLGGSGKTSLSIEFAWLYHSFYPSGIFWMSGESNSALEDSIHTLANDTNLVGSNSKETLKLTLKWLASLTSRWLLIVDNLDGDRIDGYIEELILGSWRNKSRGHIIITSRREETEIEESLKISTKDCVYLGSFTLDEGVSFVKQRTGCASSDDNDVIIELVNELGGLPLALEQAAAHIKIINCRFKDYIKRFRKMRLKILKPIRPSYPTITKERLAVTTTWQLNIDYIEKQSVEEGVGNVAVLVMKIASFLFSDNIPIEIFNAGEPFLDSKNLQEILGDGMNVRQVLEILTRFSLFQREESDSISVHRVVQEVIRDSIDKKETIMALQSATRMINKALNSTVSPQTVLTSSAVVRGSLHLWDKLAANADIVKQHIQKLSFDTQTFQSLCFNLPTAKVFQTTAIYQSINQRQSEAMGDQNQLLHILTTLDYSDLQKLTDCKIPLLHKDREKIQHCLAVVVNCEETNAEKTLVLLDANILKDKGNEAFVKKRYHDAIQYYSKESGHAIKI